MENKLSAILSEEIAKEIDKEMINGIKEMIITDNKNYLFNIFKFKDENDLYFLMKKYNILEDDLLSLQNIKSKIREYNLDIILKNN
jgi:hypothetical protein